MLISSFARSGDLHVFPYRVGRASFLRERARLMFLLTSIILLAASSSFAQWTQTNGPDGGTVLILTKNESTGHVFAGTKGGIYRSDDGGATWTWANSGIPASYSLTALYSVGTNTYAYGATPSTTGTLYRSTNEGASWTAMTASGLPTLPSVYCFLLSGSDLLAGVYELLGGSGVYKSTDNGASWTSTSTGLPSGFAAGAFGVSGSNIFAGGHINATTKGAYLSTNGGANWSAVNTNFTTTAGVTAFVTNGSTVFAATLNGGVFKTTDNGSNWTKISTAPVLGATALATTATNLFIGGSGAIYKADAAGANWDSLTVGLPTRNSGSSTYGLVIAGTNILASCSELGVWRSTNDGANWSKSSSGLRTTNVWGLMCDGSTVYTSGVANGFFRSTNNGDSWTEQNTGVNLLNNGYYGFAISGSYLIGGSGIGPYRSTDQGGGWLFPSGDYSGPAYSFVVDGTDMYASGQGLVAKSTNDGANWTTLTTGLLPQQAVLDVLKNGSIMLAATSTGGIKRSTDAGATWTASVSGLATTGYFYSFALLGSTYLVAFSGAVYRSTDDGATWTQSNSGVVGAPRALHVRGTDVYVGTNQGIYRSTNSGTSWTSISTGLPAQPLVTVLTSNTQYLFAGINPNSVWRRSLSELTSVGKGASLPDKITLDQNYPNPFNPSTMISYGVPTRAHVTLTVFNALGQQVARLVDTEQNAGSYQVQFNGAGLASGMYLYKLQAGDEILAKRLILLR